MQERFKCLMLYIIITPILYYLGYIGNTIRTYDLTDWESVPRYLFYFWLIYVIFGIVANFIFNINKNKS